MQRLHVLLLGLDALEAVRGGAQHVRRGLAAEAARGELHNVARLAVCGLRAQEREGREEQRVVGGAGGALGGVRLQRQPASGDGDAWYRQRQPQRAVRVRERASVHSVSAVGDHPRGVHVRQRGGEGRPRPRETGVDAGDCERVSVSWLLEHFLRSDKRAASERRVRTRAGVKVRVWERGGRERAAQRDAGRGVLHGEAASDGAVDGERALGPVCCAEINRKNARGPLRAGVTEIAPGHYVYCPRLFNRAALSGGDMLAWRYISACRARHRERYTRM